MRGKQKRECTNRVMQIAVFASPQSYRTSRWLTIAAMDSRDWIDDEVSTEEELMMHGRSARTIRIQPENRRKSNGVQESSENEVGA